MRDTRPRDARRQVPMAMNVARVRRRPGDTGRCAARGRACGVVWPAPTRRHLSLETAAGKKIAKKSCACGRAEISTPPTMSRIELTRAPRPGERILWRDARVCAAFASRAERAASSQLAWALRPPRPARVISHILMYYKHIQAEPCTAELQTGRGHFQAVMHTAQAWDVEGAETGPPAGRARRARRVRCGGTDRERTAGPVHAHKSAGPRRRAAPQLLYCRAAFWRHSGFSYARRLREHLENLASNFRAQSCARD